MFYPDYEVIVYKNGERHKFFSDVIRVDIQNYFEIRQVIEKDVDGIRCTVGITTRFTPEKVKKENLSFEIKIKRLDRIKYLF